jgi:protein gp37
MRRTAIPYLDYVWNISTGCDESPISPGCMNCWARRTAETRLRGRFGYPHDQPFRPSFRVDRLADPARAKKPGLVGVSFMGDLFADAFGRVEIQAVFKSAHEAPWHRFLFLTKRPTRMAHEIECFCAARGLTAPPPWFWFGISAENQHEFDRRWPPLKEIKPAVAVVSYEPALGPLDLPGSFLKRGGRSWLICGGEAAPNFRHMPEYWPRLVRDLCQSFGVPFYFKQWSGRVQGQQFLDDQIWDQYPDWEAGQ